MKTVLAFTAVAAFALAGSAYARPATAPATDVQIVYVTSGNVNDDPDLSGAPATLGSPQLAAESQAIVSHDPSIMAVLKKNDLKLSFVEAIQTAADGSKILYIR